MQNTLVRIVVVILCSVCVMENLPVLLNSSWISAYSYDDISDTIWSTDKKLLHFKLSKLGQILHVDKTGSPRPGHKYSYLKHKMWFGNCLIRSATIIAG